MPSSNQDSEEACPVQLRRLKGQKARRKGKEKGTPQSAAEDIKIERMKLYETIAKRSKEMAKMAEAAKEEAKVDMLKQYLSMMGNDVRISKLLSQNFRAFVSS